MSQAASGLRQLLPGVGGLVATALVLSPALHDAQDSFPLSTYPMFARPRGQPTLHAIVGVAADGSEQPISPALIGGGEVLQAKALIQRSVRAGRRQTAALCRDTAENVARAGTAPTPRRLAVVARRYDPIAYFVNGATPLEARVLYSCEVPEAAAAARRARGGSSP